MRNADSCFSGPGAPWAGFTGSDLQSHFRNPCHRGVHQRSDKHSCSLRLPRWLGSGNPGGYLGPELFIQDLFALAPPKPHSLVRMTKSSRGEKKKYYYYFRTSGILETTTPKLSYYVCIEVVDMHIQPRQNDEGRGPQSGEKCTRWKKQTAEGPELSLMIY